jgi:hypothetical protein
MRFLVQVFAASCLLLALAPSAIADTIQTFEISGVFNQSFPEINNSPESGTLVLDYTLGLVESASIDIPLAVGANTFWFNGIIAPPTIPSSIPISQGSPSIVVPLIWNPPGVFLNVDFLLSDPVNGFYTDGTVGVGGAEDLLIPHQCIGGAGILCNSVFNFNGTLTSVSLTPIPTTLPLFAVGLGAFSLLGWRRKRRAQARRLIAI